MDRRKRSGGAVASLPDDALAEILSRVPARPLCRFKCVSKAWRDLIADRLRCSNVPQSLEGFFYCEALGGDADADADADDSDGEGSLPRLLNWGFISASGRPAPLVDASFSFLLIQPDIQAIGLLQSCNGLVLFGHRRDSDAYDSLGYIVCNPVTEQWVDVPSSGWEPFPPWDESSEDLGSDTGNFTVTYLLFDPAVSPHFQLVEFWMDCDSDVERVHTYSSETGAWCERASEWISDEGMGMVSFAGSGFVLGMLHLSFTRFDISQELVVAVDGEGKKCKTISWQERRGDVIFIGQCHGLLHCICAHRDSTSGMSELCIWVLHDYDAEEWVLKHRVSYLHPFGFGITSCRVVLDYSVVAIHPDRNLVFVVQHWDRKLISYNMDSEEVCTLHDLGRYSYSRPLVPYVPYFAESSALANN